MLKRDYENLDHEELLAEIERLRKRKKYGLVWEEKPEDVVEQCKIQLPVLEESEDKEIITDLLKPMNIIIEGDNYHALSVLNYTHKGKIDVIYIDPPYNTGAKDWKYNNDYVDNNDQWRHSKWISFIKNRIILAKQLLSKSGFLICSIDHNELFALGMLLDEIFGEANRIGLVTVVHNPKGRNQAKYFSLNCEYMLVYANNKQYAEFNNVAINEDIKNSFDLDDEDGKYRLEPFLRSRSVWARALRPKNWYPIYVSKDLKHITHLKRDDYYEIYPIANNGKEMSWLKIHETFIKIKKDDYFIAAQEGEKIVIYRKLREKQVFKNVWTDKLYQSEFHGTNLLKEILGSNVFNFPKSVYFINDILNITSKEDSIVLDFFAGSGTTGHAVLELNKQDDGYRRFILCTNNENNIADNICYPRIKKVIYGYSFIGKEQKIIFNQKLTPNNLSKSNTFFNELYEIKRENTNLFDEFSIKVEDNSLRLLGFKNYKEYKEGLGGNLKYFKTTFVPSESTDSNKTLLTSKATEMLCIKEDTFEAIVLKDNYKIFRNSKHYTGIIFDNSLIEEFKKAIASINGRFSVYIFSLGDESFEGLFSDVSQNVKLLPIPEAILRVYRRIFKKG